MVTTGRHSVLSISLFLFLMAANNSDTLSRPEKIKPNISYYAEEFTIKGNIAELGEERNYEEVFKNYEYFETIYDEQERPSIFRAYKRGEITRTERYFYNSNGELVKKEIAEQGKPLKTLHFKTE